MVCEKITRGYKQKLSKAERKEFRSRMWEFRRDPSSLTAQEKVKLEALFEKLPELRKLYELRVEFKTIFDETQDRAEGGAGVDRVDHEVIGSVPGDGQDIRDDV